MKKKLILQENTQLRMRLDQSLAGLNETQQLCLQLQEESERERDFIQRYGTGLKLNATFVQKRSEVFDNRSA